MQERKRSLGRPQWFWPEHQKVDIRSRSAPVAQIVGDNWGMWVQSEFEVPVRDQGGGH